MPDESTPILEIFEDEIVSGTTVDAATGAIELMVIPTTSVEVLEPSEFIELYDGSFGVPAVLPSEALPFTQSGPLSVGIGTIPYPIKGGSFTILTVAAMVGGAPSGDSVIVDVNKNGASIYGTQSFRPTIAAGQNEATVGSHTVADLSDGDFLTIDVDQIGSGSPGSHLTVVVRLQRIS